MLTRDRHQLLFSVETTECCVVRCAGPLWEGDGTLWHLSLLLGDHLRNVREGHSSIEEEGCREESPDHDDCSRGSMWFAEYSSELREKLDYLYSSNNRVRLYFDLPVLSKAVVAYDDPGRQVTLCHIALSHKSVTSLWMLSMVVSGFDSDAVLIGSKSHGQDYDRWRRRLTGDLCFIARVNASGEPLSA